MYLSAFAKVPREAAGLAEQSDTAGPLPLWGALHVATTRLEWHIDGL